MSKHSHSGSSSCHPKARRHLKSRQGATIEDVLAHQQAHQEWGRRDFLKVTGLAALSSSLMLSGFPVSAFAPNPVLASLAGSECGNRALVLIRLKGGNDGLNTVIQRGNDTYYNIRPTLAVPESGLWALSDEYGMPNELIGLQPFWEEGRMKVVHNVSYPEQNYSHFRSSDIWASASDSSEAVTTGWLGRWLEQDLPAFLSAPPVVPPALQIGVQPNMVFRSDTANFALAISNPAAFYQIAQTGTLYEAGNLGNQPFERELRYVRQVANNAFRYSESIQRAYNDGGNQADYPDNYLAEQLAIVARMIKGRLGTKIYMVTLDGFDTHSSQAAYHPALLSSVGNSIAAFFSDLEASGQSGEVLAMTFSEFGRTIYENGSAGTDHGTGAPMLLLGGTVEGGFLGQAPDLDQTDQYGDPLFSVDFRSVYASVLQNWLCTPEGVADYLLGDSLQPLQGLLPASALPSDITASGMLLGHERAAGGAGTAFDIHYAIKLAGPVRIVLLKDNGARARVLFEQYQEAGSHHFIFEPAAFFLPPGKYYYRLEAGGRAFTRLIAW